MANKSKKLMAAITAFMFFSSSYYAVVKAETGTKEAAEVKGAAILSERISGSNRYETAAAISKANWPSGSEYVLIARGDEFPDALCASPLAKMYNAPILLTDKDELSTKTLEEIKRLGAKNVIILGGVGAISEKVEKQLSNVAKVERIWGNNRYETSAKIAKRLGAVNEVVLAYGEKFADAMSIAPIAGIKKMPILLSEKDNVPTSILNYLKEQKISNSYIVGGEGVISRSVENAVLNPKRLNGDDRYKTNLAVLKAFEKELNFDNVFMANVSNDKDGFVDALVGSAAAAMKKAPLVLVSSTMLEETNMYINGKITSKSKITAIGGNSLIPNDIISKIVVNNNSKANENNSVISSNSSSGAGGGTSSGSNSGSGSSSSSNNGQASEIMQATISKAGIYGPTSGKQNFQGDVTVNAPGVTLQNVKIAGNLILAEGIGEGDVNLNGVEVTGTTNVRAGGKNSIHFNNSVLATVIVNKNNGAVRIVAEGNTSVIEVQLESPAIVQENNLTSNSSGFNNVTLSNAFQASNGVEPRVEFIGKFETINSRVENVKINLDSETDIRTLVLDAIATVLGGGNINLAQINANGSTLSQRPQNVVLDNSVTARIGNQDISTGYSSETNTTIKSIKATLASADIDFEKYVAGIALSDLEITAKLDGQPYTLSNLNFNEKHNRLTFDRVPLANNIGKHFEVTVSPKNGSTKVSDEAKSFDVEVKQGFEGRITDISKIGMSGVTIKFRAGVNTREGQVVGTAITNKYGYYSISLPAGTYTGEFSGNDFVTSYMVAVAPSDVYNIDQNETAIRAAGSNEIKIMLSWGEKPRDEDSHLVGPKPNEDGQFHTWYGQKKYIKDGVVYADLDWDDTQSYGPETTVIRKTINGKYKFYVHNYSGEDCFNASGAKVEVFIGNKNLPDYTFNIPTEENHGRYWMVFDLNINGNDISISPINKIVNNVKSNMPNAFVDNKMLNRGLNVLPIGTEIKLGVTGTTTASSIYYTTDGNEPTENSNLYNSPIRVNGRMVIKAVAIEQGMVNSDIMYLNIVNEDHSSIKLDKNTIDITSGSSITIKELKNVDGEDVLNNFSSSASFNNFNYSLKRDNIWVRVNKNTTGSAINFEASEAYENGTYTLNINSYNEGSWSVPVEITGNKMPTVSNTTNSAISFAIDFEEQLKKDNGTGLTLGENVKNIIQMSCSSTTGSAISVNYAQYNSSEDKNYIIISTSRPAIEGDKIEFNYPRWFKGTFLVKYESGKWITQ